MMKRRAVFWKIVPVLLFAAVIFSSPLAFFVQDDQAVSTAENRRMAPLPKLSPDLSSLASFPADFEKYYNDRFGLRNFFIGLMRRGRPLISRLTGINLVENVVGGRIIRGREGWLFLNHIEGDPLEDFRNLALYSDRELRLVTLAIAARKHWMARHGIGYLFFVAPNKHTIYPEFLPEYIGKKGEVSAMDQLYGALAEYTTVPFVDLRPPLWQGKEQAAGYWPEEKESARLYWRTDSHWNSAGADIAQYEIMRRVARMFPGEIVPRKRPKEDFLFEPGRGDLTRYLPPGEVYDERVPVIFTGRCARATSRDYRQRVLRTTCSTGRLNALVFHDSFLLALRPFLADYFASGLFLWQTLTKEAVASRIETFRPDLVIEELAERFLPYVPDIWGETYYSFWQANYDKWDRLLLGLDRQNIMRLENMEVQEGVENSSLILQAANGDPQIYLPPVPFERNKLYIMKVVMESPADTMFQVYYNVREAEERFPAADLVKTVRIHRGMNTIFVLLFDGNLAGRLRVDPGMAPGRYVMTKLEVRGIGDFSRSGVWQ